jgi:hypothetical protein
VRRLVVFAAALLVGGCDLGVIDFEPRAGAVEVGHAVLAEPSGWPEPLFDDWAEDQGGLVVATTVAEMEEVWADPIRGDPPLHFLDTSVIVVFGVLEAAACPMRVFTVDAMPDGGDVGIHLHYPARVPADCGREFAPRTFAVAVPIGAVGDDELSVTVVRPDGREETRTAGVGG